MKSLEQCLTQGKCSKSVSWVGDFALWILCHLGTHTSSLQPTLHLTDFSEWDFLFNSIPLLVPAIAMPELLGKSEERLVCQGNFPKFLFLEEKIRQWPRSAVWGWRKAGASFCQWSCHSIFQAPRCRGGVRVAWLWARRHRRTSRVSQMQSTQEPRLFGFWAPSATYNLYRGPSVYWLCGLGHVRVSMTHFPHLQNRDPNSGQSSEGCKD